MGSNKGSIGPGTKLGVAQLRKLPEVEALSEKQRIVVEAMLAEKTVDEAMALAGYSETVNAITVVGSAGVQRAIQAACDAELGGVVRIQALRAMKGMLKEDTPAATRFQAAKWVLERGDGNQSDDDRPLSEMTPDELQRFIRDAETRLAEAGKPRFVDVTPDNGAQRDPTP